MEKRQFKNTNEQISLLGLGCMRFPKVSPDSENIDYAEAQKIVDHAYASGVNYFDTAYRYHGGDSELFIGQALKKYPRESFYLATKFPVWMAETEADVERIFNDQLARCQVEYFDFYLCHALSKTSFDKLVSLHVYEFLSKMKEAGKIRRLGFSFHDAPAVLEEICSTYAWDFAQIQLNYLDWDLQDAKGQYEILEKHGIQAIIMEPVRGGLLANPGEGAAALFQAARPESSVASWAIRYAATLPNVLTVLSGMSNLEQLSDNLKTVTNFEPVTADEQKIIDTVVTEHLKKDYVPCTGCRYCMDCPFGVDIPKTFGVFNDYALSKNEQRFVKQYAELPESEKPHNCQKCGACVEKCPQHIDIPEKLGMVMTMLQENTDR